MTDTPSVDWFALSPTLALLAAVGLALLAAVLAPSSWRKPLAAGIAAAGFATAAALAVVLYVESADGELVLVDAFARDRLTALTTVIVAGAGLLSVGISWSERLGRGEHVGEYYALLAAAGGGMVFLVGASNLLTLFLGLEWFSISLYILCAIAAERPGSLEAGLKYLIVGSFGSAVLLFGSALVYGATGELGFDAIATAARTGGLEDDPLLLAGL
ncbi:MAG: hypothetical protein H0V40_06085, partial [Actinobacteria bacterium]|nr:hypothetical protein [Actinomycetota bacterium]